MNYLLIKHVHVTAVTLSILLFVLRSYWSVIGSDKLKSKIVRILPHIIDTILLVAGVTLAAVIGPEQPWILAKIVGLLFYIGVGTVAIKRGKTPKSRAIAAVIAVVIFIYIIGIAMSHNPLSWFA
ncbi:SirB2 family protein [Allopusillimonas ginsengisoli]|uniref:SirB2 family protein n=1 Tax=Allopusillimonas ginsengisoli TaxID=453575 RepID=UPI0010C1EC66|nr:regulator SirB [Allopusillimonas ginsengisoli]